MSDPVQDDPRNVETVAFLLVPSFSMIAFTSAVEPLRIANRLSGRILYRWPVISKDGAPVAASNGISVQVDLAMDRLELGPGADRLAVLLCSGIGAERYRDREVFALLRRLDRRGVTLGALCTGAHVLARAGLLNGHRCTIHWENLPGFLEAFPDVEASADLFEIDGKRLTCSGGTAALDLMLFRIAERHGQELRRRGSPSSA